MSDKSNEECVIVYNEEGEPVRWGFMTSRVIKRFMEEFVFQIYPTKEIAQIFRGKASWC